MLGANTIAIPSSFIPVISENRIKSLINFIIYKRLSLLYNGKDITKDNAPFGASVVGTFKTCS